MRRFSSYGPINTKLHYYTQREALIHKAYTQLTAENTGEGGHYITVWAPRQSGKTWVMQEVVQKIKKMENYEAGMFSLGSAKKEKNEEEVISTFVEKLSEVFQKKFPSLKKIRHLPSLFTKKYFQKPLILIIDEFDSLEEDYINDFANIFREIFSSRSNETDKKSKDKTHLLHGLALVGVRSVLGIENVTGSPFNVQRSLHIPNLTYEEVEGMFTWYKEESGQRVEKAVIDQMYYETNGQPGLTCWFGELLTETYNEDINKAITIKNFEEVHAAAVKVLPNNNILNIISKANKEPYKQTVLELFKTDRKIEFTYDNKQLNYLYMNGVIDREEVNRIEYYVKFSCPFVQKRLFNYFSSELFHSMGRLYEPFENLDNTITETHLDIRNLMKLYQTYLRKNREWLFQDAPRRKDLHIYEAVYHFNLYSYLNEFLRPQGGRVFPEFPTGNGKIDLIVTYAGNRSGIELKSYVDERNYRDSLQKAAKYGKQLELAEIFLVIFVESIDDKSRKTYEVDYLDNETGVKVLPIFVETGY